MILPREAKMLWSKLRQVFYVLRTFANTLLQINCHRLRQCKRDYRVNKMAKKYLSICRRQFTTFPSEPIRQPRVRRFRTESDGTLKLCDRWVTAWNRRIIIFFFLFPFNIRVRVCVCVCDLSKVFLSIPKVNRRDSDWLSRRRRFAQNGRATAAGNDWWSPPTTTEWIGLTLVLGRRPSETTRVHLYVVRDRGHRERVVGKGSRKG